MLDRDDRPSLDLRRRPPPPLLIGDDGTVVTTELEGRPLLGVGVARRRGHARSRCRRSTPCCSSPTAWSSAAGTSLLDRSEDLVRLAADRRGDESLDDWVDRIISASGSTDDDTTVLAVRRP